jgi:hypothetical protein
MFVPLALCVTAILGITYGRGPLFLGLAFSVLLAAISLFWASLLSLTGDAPLTLNEALGLAAPSAEEERKVAILRSLKDLEYERSVGKIGDADYRELSLKYRTEAKHLLQVVDDQMTASRARAEALVAEYLETHAEPEPKAKAPAETAPPETAIVAPAEPTDK